MESLVSEYIVRIGGREVGRVVYENLSPQESGDPTLVTVERDGVLVAGIDINGTASVDLGHWPDGEEWVAVSTARPATPEIDLELPDEEHDVAVVVIARAAGVSAADASDRVAATVSDALGGWGATLPLPHRGTNVKGRTVKVAKVMDVGTAAGNGYLWTRVTGKAFHEHPRFHPDSQ